MGPLNHIYLSCLPSFIIPSEEDSDYPWVKLFHNNLRDLNSIIEFDVHGLDCNIFKNSLENYTNFKIYCPENSPKNFSYFFKIARESDLETITNKIQELKQSSSPIQESHCSLKDLSEVQQEILNSQLGRLAIEISELELKPNKSSLVERKIGKALKYLDVAKNFKILFQEDTPTISSAVFYEIFRLSLFCEVEINYARHDNTDPVTGWINSSKYFPQELPITLSNPFLGIKFARGNSGIIDCVDYFPRKISLNQFRPTIYFSTQLDSLGIPKAKPNSESPILMRRNPDLYGLKFLEKFASTEISKVFYFRSGLTPLGNYSTTGFEFDFWIEEELKKLPSQGEITPLYLNIALSLQCDASLIRFRTLSEVGGVSPETLDLEKGDKLNITKSETAGGLRGLRIIDSANYLVLDYRFTKSIGNISILNIAPGATDASNLHLAIDLGSTDLKSYDKRQNLTFSIY